VFDLGGRAGGHGNGRGGGGGGPLAPPPPPPIPGDDASDQECLGRIMREAIKQGMMAAARTISAATTAPSSKAKKNRAEKPEKFPGKWEDPKTFRNTLNLYMAKILSVKDHITAALMLLVPGLANNWGLTWMQANKTNFELNLASWNNFLVDFDSHFKDPYIQDKAAEELLKLTIKCTEMTLSFFQHFNLCRLTAKMTDINFDYPQICHLEKVLPHNLIVQIKAKILTEINNEVTYLKQKVASGKIEQFQSDLTLLQARSRINLMSNFQRITNELDQVTHPQAYGTPLVLRAQRTVQPLQAKRPNVPMTPALIHAAFATIKDVKDVKDMPRRQLTKEQHDNLYKRNLCYIYESPEHKTGYHSPGLRCTICQMIPTEEMRKKHQWSISEYHTRLSLLLWITKDQIFHRRFGRHAPAITSACTI